MTITLSLLSIDRSTLRLRIHTDKDDAKLAREMEKFTELVIANSATFRSEAIH
jgi:hypothetical protein